MKKLLLALSVLLCLASQASAGCAWVLWQTDVDDKGKYNPDRFQPIMAHETKAKCESDMATLLGAEAQLKFGRFMVRCLPETVDPRPHAKSN